MYIFSRGRHGGSNVLYHQVISVICDVMHTEDLVRCSPVLCSGLVNVRDSWNKRETKHPMSMVQNGKGQEKVKISLLTLIVTLKAHGTPHPPTGVHT